MSEICYLQWEWVDLVDQPVHDQFIGMHSSALKVRARRAHAPCQTLGATHIGRPSHHLEYHALHVA
jgi:hypothetical protein